MKSKGSGSQGKGSDGYDNSDDRDENIEMQHHDSHTIEHWPFNLVSLSILIN